MATKPQKTEEKKAVSIKVNPNTVVGSQFAHIVGIAVENGGVTLDFIFVNPQIKTKEGEDKKGESVARITIPQDTAKKLSELITDTIKKHENKERT